MKFFAAPVHQTPILHLVIQEKIREFFQNAVLKNDVIGQSAEKGADCKFNFQSAPFWFACRTPAVRWQGSSRYP
jgi:hypothetical protein